MGNKPLILKMVSDNLAAYSVLRTKQIPGSGWIASIRQALNMTMEQLGQMLGVSRQAVSQMETRESEGTITLNGLREVANVLDMQLVYAIVPKTGTLEEYVEKRATELAREILLEAHQHMRLEAQAVDKEELKRAIRETADEFIRKVDRQLWN